MRDYRQGLIVFVAILATCTAGILNASWWACVVGGCVLALISITNQALAGNGASSTGRPASGVLLVATVLNAAVTSSAALGAGRLIGTAWGV
jgi:hypothetical protein